MIKGERVRIMCVKRHKEAPLRSIRGQVLDEDAVGIKVSGRRFQQVMDEAAGKTIEKPIDAETKVFFIPFSSIRLCEVILEGTRSDMIDRKAKREGVLPKSEIKKQEDTF